MPKVKKYKLKKHSGAAKRLRITATGLVMREGAGDKHFNAKKSKRRLRNTAIDKRLAGRLARKLKKVLGA